MSGFRIPRTDVKCALSVFEGFFETPDCAVLRGQVNFGFDKPPQSLDPSAPRRHYPAENDGPADWPLGHA